MADEDFEEDIIVTSAAAIIAVDVAARKLLKRRRCWVRPCYQFCLGSLWSRITIINIHELSTIVAVDFVHGAILSPSISTPVWTRLKVACRVLGVPAWSSAGYHILE